jgi:hypothetical protein
VTHQHAHDMLTKAVTDLNTTLGPLVTYENSHAAAPESTNRSDVKFVINRPRLDDIIGFLTAYQKSLGSPDSKATAAAAKATDSIAKA